MNKQRHFSVDFCTTIIIALLTVNAASGQQLEGTVTAGGAQPLANMLVKAQAKGGVQTVVTKTDSSGHFVLSDLKTSAVLLSIERDGKLVFRTIVSLPAQSPLNISLATPISKSQNWRPADLAADEGPGVFVLDTRNSVSRITVSSDGTHLEPVFSVPPVFDVGSIAASQQFVFATANNRLGCSIFRYSLATKSISAKAIINQGFCTGIAVEGETLYVVFSGQNGAKHEVKYWKSWAANSHQAWSLDSMQSPGPLFLDRVSHQLLLADTSNGALYSLSIADGKLKKLVDNIGSANQLTADSRHVIIASGKKLLVVSRANYRGESPPINLQSLTGGNISGVAIDGTGRLWYADLDNHLVQGPLSID
jgi:hypothetical protein